LFYLRNDLTPKLLVNYCEAIPLGSLYPCKKTSDSRIVLDQIGAEKLLSAEDMLVRPQAGATAIRLHGVSITKSDVTECLNHVMKQ